MLKKVSNVLIYSLLAALFVIALVASAISTAVKRSNDKKALAKLTETVITVGDVDVPKDEFILACVSVIETELDDLKTTAMTEDVITEAVKQRAAENLREYVALLKTADENGIKLTDGEEKLIEKNADELGDNDFFHKKYGLSKERYVQIKKNWKLCDKYLESICNGIKYTDEQLLEIYGMNEPKLATALVDLIFFDTTVVDGGVGGLSRIEADKVFRNVSENPALFESLYMEYNDAGFPGDGLMRLIDEGVYNNFPEIFEAAINGEPGDILKVESANGIAVFEILSKKLFDKVKSEEKIKKLLTEKTVREAVDSAVGEFAIEKKPLYESISLTQYIDERSKLN